MVSLTNTPLKIRPDLSPLKTGVYAIRNKVNGKCYVGSAALGIEARFRQHIAALKRGKHHSYKLQSAWNEFGEENFEFVVIAKCNPEWCVAIEQIHIKRLDSVKSGYNVCPNAGSAAGKKHTEETKKKFREIAAKRVMSQETIERIRSTLKRMWSDPSYKKIMSQKMRAGITPEGIRLGIEKRKGIQVPIEVRKKISESHKRMAPDVRARIDEARWAGDARKKQSEIFKNRKWTDAHKENHRNGMLGHPVSDECKKRLSESTKRLWENPAFRSSVVKKLKGHSVSHETRKKISDSLKGTPAHNKGKPHTDEHRAKLRAAWIIRKQRKRHAS